MSDLIARWTRWLIHPRLRDGTLEERTVGLLAAWFFVAGVVGPLLLCVHALVTGDHAELGARAAVAALALPIGWLTHRGAAPRVLRIYLTAVAWALVTMTVTQSGGATSRALYQYALVIFVAAGVGGARYATAGFVAALGSVEALYLLDALGVVFPARGGHVLAVSLPSLAFATALAFGMTALVVVPRRAARVQVEGAVQAVARANARARAARRQLERARAANTEVTARVGWGFRSSLGRLARLAGAIDAALPAALHEHAAMIARGASELLARLEGFIAYADAAPTSPAALPDLVVSPIASASALIVRAPLPVPRRAAFWRFVDRALHASFASAAVERRTRARAVTAILLIVAAVGPPLALLDAVMPGTEPAIALGASALALALLATLRRTGHLVVAVVAVVALIVAIGAGQLAVRSEPGNPTTVWILLLGLLPTLIPAWTLAGLVVVATVALASALAAPPPLSPSLTPVGNIVGLCIVAWAVIVVVLDTHAMALAEHRDELTAQREREARLNLATSALAAEARETELLLTTMSHELRSPLNGVLGLADLLTHEPLAAPVRGELAEVERVGRAVLRAFDTLLCVARVAAVGPEAPRPLDLTGVVEAAAAKAERATPGTIAVRAAAPDGPRVVSGPLVALRVALDQLAGSAVEAGLVGLALTWGSDGAGIVVTLCGEAPVAAPAGGRDDLSLGLALVAALAEAVGGSCVAGTPEPGRWAATLRLPGGAAQSP